jgi:hypothetical protein
MITGGGYGLLAYDDTVFVSNTGSNTVTVYGA